MYFYHGYSLGVGSTIKDKQFTEASCALSVRGGIATADSAFDKYGISFKAQSKVSGAAVKRNGVYVWVTDASVAITDLEIMGRITADGIDAHVISEFRPGDYESNTVITGSSFKNLKIDGNPVQVDLSEEMFGRYLTYGSMEADFTDDFTKPRLLGCLVGRDLPDTVTASDLLAARDSYQEQKALPSLRSAVISSLVKKVTVGGGISSWGPIMSVPNLGTVYLGEVIVWPWMRCLTMFRIELISGGSVSGGSAGANGTTFPPGAYGGGAGGYGNGGG